MLIRAFRRIFGIAVSLIRRYRLQVPITAFEAALFDSIRYTVRRFFSQREISIGTA